MKFEEIRNVAMIGSGTMGAGMSWCFAQAGYNVKLHDVSPQQIEQACTRIEAIRKLFVHEGLISAEEGRTAGLKESLADVQYVLEAVPERLPLKHQLFSQFERFCPPDTILATNTSGLRITDIAAVCQHPGRVGGMHWANPAEIVPLVEVIRGERTSNPTVNLICRVAERLGKEPVVVNKDIPGFVSNRLQCAVFREALHLVETGVVSAKDVDRTLKCGVGFRYPWLGPLETADLGGLDVFHGVSQYLFKELSSMTTLPEFFDRIIGDGKLGIKTGQGFYDYKDVSREEILRKRDLYFIRQLKLIREVKGS